MRVFCVLAALAAAFSSPVHAVDWVQGNWQGGAVAGSTTSAVAGWNQYDSQSGGVVVLSTGLQSLILSSSWTQTDNSVSTAGFFLPGNSLNNTQVLGAGPSAFVKLINSETFTTKSATIPRQRSAMAISTFPATGKIYLFGGRNNDDGSLSNQILQYDPMTDAISVMPTVLPSSADYIEAAYAPNTNKIYLFGGYNGCAQPCGMSSIWKYDPVAGTISTMTVTLPTGRFAGGVAYHPSTNKLYYFGGTQGGGANILSHTTYYTQILVYDPVGDTLSVDAAQIPSDGFFPNCSAYGVVAFAPVINKIEMIGGIGQGGIQCLGIDGDFDPVADTMTIPSGQAPGGAQLSAAAYHPASKKIYVFGGCGGAGCSPGSNSNLEHSPGIGVTSRSMPNLPQLFYNNPASYYAGTDSIFIFGGGSTFSQIYEYKFTAVGTYTSAVFDTGNTANLGTISWNPVTQSTTAVTLTVGLRAGPTPTPDASWTNGGNFATVANGGSLASFNFNRYVQYIATFTTTIVSSSPVLNDLTITYTNYPPSATLISSAFNTGSPRNVIQKIAWQGLFPSSATAQFQIRTTTDNGSGFPGSWGPWLGPTSAGDYYTNQSGAQVINPAQSDGSADQWFQYKAVLLSTNVFATPTLTTATITTNLMPVSPFLSALTANTSTQLIATLTDQSDNEDEFVVSSGTVSGPTNLGATVATLSKAGTGGTQAVAIDALSPNTTYYVRLSAHVLPPVGLYSFYSNELSVATLAAPPAALGVTAVYGSSVAVSWNVNGNPAGTPFEVSISTDNFALNISTPVGFASNLTAAATVLTNLSSGTTYYFRVRARNLAGVATAFAGTASTPTVPGALGPPSGSALGISSITWSWTNTVGPVVQSYNVYSAATGLLLTATTSTAFVQTGLAANTPYGISVVAVDASGAGPPSAAATTYALAAPPTATGFSVIYVSSLTVAWNGGGNPAATVFEVRRATDGASFALVSSQTATAFSDSQLGNATYYYKVRAINGGGLATVYDAVVSTFMAGQPPSPPSGLTLANSSGTIVTLTWNASPSPGLLQYDVYWDSGTGAINYAATYSTVTASTTSFTTGLLAPGTYYFAVRAKNSIFLEEQNVNVKASITVVAAAPISNWIQTRLLFPASGKIVWGNRVTLDAGLLRGSLSGISQVRFDYRSAASTTAPWIAVTATEANNPVLKLPFYIHWDVTGLTPGAYEVRAVAGNGSGQADPNPPTALVTVGSLNPDITETAVGGSIQHLETVSNAVDNAAFVGGPAGGQTLQVQLPAGALGASTSTVLQIMYPAVSPPPVAAALVPAGISVQITLQSGQTALSVPAVLTAAYQDANGDGIVDGTSARADRLAFMVYQAAGGAWKAENATTLDLAGKTVTVQTPHFSLFGVFAAAAAALDSVRVYPNPYRPNGNNPDQGKPYSSADSTSGIIFDNLTQGARIQIFDVSGEMVWQAASQITSGKIQWDAKNSQGRDAATGGYIAIIRDLATGSSVVKKIAIIRH